MRLELATATTAQQGDGRTAPVSLKSSGRSGVRLHKHAHAYGGQLQWDSSVSSAEIDGAK